MQVNYRSNQEILDFANVLLSDIEANQYAHIQLQANSLAPVTAQSFEDKVHLHYEQLGKMSDFKPLIGTLIASPGQAYIDECLKRNEQVCVLAYERFTANTAADTLKRLYPNRTVANIIPEKMYNQTVFSTYIMKFWDQLNFAPNQTSKMKLTTFIIDDIRHKLEDLVTSADRARPGVDTMLARWQNDEGATIDAWQDDYLAGKITKDEFLELVRDAMLSYEIRTNAVKQSLLSNKNAQAKAEQDAANADFVVSTIHSAKGLEFDNVIVFMKDVTKMDEELKRMYYVALTRAKVSELIIAYGTHKKPKVQSDWNGVVTRLEEAEQALIEAQAEAIANPVPDAESADMSTETDAA